MVQAIININDNEDRILNMVKAKQGFKNKSEAISFIIKKFEEESFEPELRPEYIEKIRKIEKQGKFKDYKNFEELRRDIEHA